MSEKNETPKPEAGPLPKDITAEKANYRGKPVAFPNGFPKTVSPEAMKAGLEIVRDREKLPYPMYWPEK